MTETSVPLGAATLPDSKLSESEKFDLKGAYKFGALGVVLLLQGRLRWFLVAAGLLWASGAVAHIVLSAYWLPPPLWTPDNVRDAVYIPLGIGFAYAMARGLGTRGWVASELELSADGVVITYLHSPERRLTWTAQTLHGALLRRSGDRILRGRTAYALTNPEWPWPVLIGADAFEAVNRRVHELGLVLREFTRELPPVRLKAVEFGSPNAVLEPLPADALSLGGSRTGE
ncbi:MAG: hypothetical protein L3J97_01505 [Thermoplasmata archaeon]|nr:hypothetical protein [Thermoplasmata archaeon]